MPRPLPFRSLPLPRGWPRRVRSAVVQVISLARTSLALSQSWASESLNRELRRRAEGDRLQAETQLLREEIRIKDARMEQLEAHRRPHYPPTERLAILELRAARGWSLTQTARTFLVSPLTIASWMGRLDEEGPDALVRLPERVYWSTDFLGSDSRLESSTSFVDFLSPTPALNPAAYNRSVSPAYTEPAKMPHSISVDHYRRGRLRRRAGLGRIDAEPVRVRGLARAIVG